MAGQAVALWPDVIARPGARSIDAAIVARAVWAVVDKEALRYELWQSINRQIEYPSICIGYLVNPRNIAIMQSRRRNMLKEFICEYCGQPFARNVYPSRKAMPRFCGPTCRNKARTLKPIPCPICGTPFKPDIVDTGSVRRKTCSPECGHVLRTRSPSPKRTPKEIVDELGLLYQKHTAKEVAKITGRSIGAVRAILDKAGIRLPIPVARRRQCNGSRIAMLTNNPMSNPETAAKVQAFWDKHPQKRRAIALHASRVNQRDRPSRLEQRLWHILESLGIAFERQVTIKDKFIVDIRIGNLIIEADGDYWHGHPRFEPLTERQLAQQSRDRSRDKYLAACGYTVKRVWGSDMSIDYVGALLQKHGILSDSQS